MAAHSDNLHFITFFTPKKLSFASIYPNVTKVGERQSRGAVAEAVFVLLRFLGNKGSGALRLSFGKKYGDKMAKILKFAGGQIQEW
jgi:hypothetical protein